MPLPNKDKDQSEVIKAPEAPKVEAAPETPEVPVSVEQKPESEAGKMEELRAEIEQAEVGEDVKVSASTQAQNLKLLDDQKKLAKLLELARTKGIIYAVKVAQKMEDPFLLDSLHDMMVKEGYYQKFKK